MLPPKPTNEPGAKWTDLFTAIAQIDEREDAARNIAIGVRPTVCRGAEFHAPLRRWCRLMCRGFRAPDPHTQGPAADEGIGCGVGDEVSFRPSPLGAMRALAKSGLS